MILKCLTMSHEEQNTHHNASYQETSTADCCHSPNLREISRIFNVRMKRLHALKEIYSCSFHKL
jgi:hypothetical protein